MGFYIGNKFTDEKDFIDGHDLFSLFEYHRFQENGVLQVLGQKSHESNNDGYFQREWRDATEADCNWSVMSTMSLFDSESVTVDVSVSFLKMVKCSNVKLIASDIHYLALEDCSNIEIPDSVIVLSVKNCRGIKLPEVAYETPVFDTKSDKNLDFQYHTYVFKKGYSFLRCKHKEFGSVCEKGDLENPAYLMYVDAKLLGQYLSDERFDELQKILEKEDKEMRKKAKGGVDWKNIIFYALIFATFMCFVTTDPNQLAFWSIGPLGLLIYFICWIVKRIIGLFKK
ncbi:MAG: hypothetical protein MJZ00_01800 [Paludibacteraceae bacterium]|nr:hypothetical protein [Paludibacteraceae bacterium]